MTEYKKYLMVLTDLGMGGVTTAAVNFCNGLCRHGAQVEVLIMTECSNLQDFGFCEDIKLLQLKGLSKLWNLGSNTIKSTKNIFKKALYLSLAVLKKVVNRKKLWTNIVFRKKYAFCGYDVAIAYRQCQPCYYFVLNNIEAKKKIAFVHGDLAFMGDISTWKVLAESFDAVAYVSNAVKEGFIREYPELSKNAVTIYNTFLTDEIIRKSKLECDIAYNNNKINLITVSRIENTLKGTGRIAPICKLLKERYPNKFHWYVVGDGPDLEKCNKQRESMNVADHLTFLGSRVNPFNYLAQADICVFTTFTEAFPMIVGECLIVGTPIVTTRYPEVAEIIEDYQNGLIAEQSEDSVFEKISELFENEELRKFIKSNCVSFEYDNERSYRQFWGSLEL